MQGSLDSKAAIITGGARGIGREIALTFARAGCDVAIADLLSNELPAISDELRRLGRNVLACEVDVSQSDAVTTFVAQVERAFGRIDIAVNNAAYIYYGPFLEFPEAEWDKVMASSLKGVFLVGQAVARVMVARREGSIINIASIAGEVGVPLGSAYCAAKGGVIALTKLMATELAPHRVRVNAIAPGVVDTANVRRVVGDEGMRMRQTLVPLGRLGTPEDIARTALFLAADDAAFITGHVLNVDGGFMAAAVALR